MTVVALASVADVRSDQSDVSTHPLARLWTKLDDDQLLAHLVSASRRAEDITGARLLPFTTLEQVLIKPAVGGYRASVRHRPPLREEAWEGELTAVTDRDSSGAAVDVDVDSITFTPTLGRLYLPSSLGWWGEGHWLDVAYAGGYTTSVEDLVEATVLLAGDSWLVGTDSRNGQPDALDLYNRAMSILKPWADRGKRSRALSVPLS